jgi:NAD-dependent histone deacetylase SIR2
LSLFTSERSSTLQTIVQDFRSKDGLYHQTFPHGSCTLKGSQLFDLSTLEDHEKLHILNKVMLELRVLVRKARPTAFHRLVSALHSFGCLVQCYTQNFDGLQTRDDPEMDRVVFELHGTNTELKCRVCQRRPPQAAEHYDQRLADEIVVACPHCLKHGKLEYLVTARLMISVCRSFSGTEKGEEFTVGVSEDR